MSDSSQRKIGAILSYISIIVSTIVQLLYTPVLIRMLGQNEYGLYSLVSSIIGYLSVLDLGFGNALVIFTAKYKAQGKIKEEKKLHGMFFLVFCIIGFVTFCLGIILYIIAPIFFINTMSSMEISKMKIMILILTFNLIISFVFSVYSSIITAYEKFTFQKIMSIINVVLKPLIMLPLLLIGFKSITMTISITLVNVICVISNYVYCRNKLNIRIKYNGFDKTIFKTIFGYSFYIFLTIIVDKVNWNVDNFILGAVSGTVAVSIYSVASQFINLFMNLSTAVNGVMLPKVSKIVAKKADLNLLSNEFIKVGRIQYYIIFLMCSGLVLFGKNFIIFWAGKEFTTSYYVLIILLIPACIPLIQNMGLNIMQAMNKYKFKAIMTTLMSFINIIISVFLAKKYGPIGSAIGTSLATIVCNILILNFYYHKVIGINIISFWKNIGKISVPFSIPIIIIIFVMKITKLDGILGFLLYGSTYTIIYSLICYFISMNKYEKNLIDNFFKKIIHNKKQTI